MKFEKLNIQNIVDEYVASVLKCSERLFDHMSKTQHSKEPHITSTNWLATHKCTYSMFNKDESVRLHADVIKYA